QHAAGEIEQRLAVWRCKAVGVVPKGTQGVLVFEHDLRRVAPFPSAEMQLAQVRLDLQWQTRLLRQLLGKGPAALQRRADHHIPVATNRRGAQLLPATRAERHVTAAEKAATRGGFTVAQQVEAQAHASFPATAASAEVAISPCRAQARRSSGSDTPAPLPSPRRMPSCNGGWASSAAGIGAWPGSAPLWANNSQSATPGFRRTAISAAAVQITPSTNTVMPCWAQPR